MFSKGKSRPKEKKERTISKSLTKWAATLIVGLLAWIGLTAAQAYVLTDKDISSVVYATKDIEAGTTITKDNVSDYFGIEAVNSALVTKTTYTSLEDVTGRLTTDVSMGEVLTSARLVDTSKINSSLKDPVEVSFAVSNADGAVNGYIRSGDVVDLYVSENANVEGETNAKTNNLLLANVYIVNSYDSGYAEIPSNDNSTIALYFVIEMERQDAANFYNQISKGDVTLVRVKDVE